MSGGRPFLSILIPTWERVDEVAAAVRSVGTTDPDTEIVVVDNASDAPVFARLSDALTPFPNVGLHRNETNLGMVRNWNHCIALAEGEWMGLLCSDDAYVPGGVERARRLLAGLPGPALVVADPNATEPVTRFPPGPEAARSLRLPIASGNFWHRDVPRAVGVFDERFEYSADAEFWPRCATRFPVVTVREPFAEYREHADNYMWNTWARPDFLAQTELLARTVLSHQFPEGAADPALLEERCRDAVFGALLSVVSSSFLTPGKGPLFRAYFPRALRAAAGLGKKLALGRALAVGAARRLRGSPR